MNMSYPYSLRGSVAMLVGSEGADTTVSNAPSEPHAGLIQVLPLRQCVWPLSLTDIEPVGNVAPFVRVTHVPDAGFTAAVAGGVRAPQRAPSVVTESFRIRTSC